jgi:hypothetical protein
MPKINKSFHLEVTVEQFLNACSPIELQEINMRLDTFIRKAEASQKQESHGSDAMYYAWSKITIPENGDRIIEPGEFYLKPKRTYMNAVPIIDPFPTGKQVLVPFRSFDPDKYFDENSLISNDDYKRTLLFIVEKCLGVEFDLSQGFPDITESQIGAMDVINVYYVQEPIDLIDIPIVSYQDNKPHLRFRPHEKYAKMWEGFTLKADRS